MEKYVFEALSSLRLSICVWFQRFNKAKTKNGYSSCQIVRTTFFFVKRSGSKVTIPIVYVDDIVVI